MELIKQLALRAHQETLDVYRERMKTEFAGDVIFSDMYDQRFAELIIEETLKQVDDRTYGRGENQWHYDHDKMWVRLHFDYGELKEHKKQHE